MISIIVPTYNRAKLIHRSLDSIMNQTSSDWECLIIDDYSNDNTKQVVQSYINNDNRFSYHLNERRKGAQGARNTGIMKAKGEYVCFFDSDDFMYPNYIDLVCHKIKENNNKIILTYGQMIDERTSEKMEVMKNIDDGNLHIKLLRGGAYVAYNMAVIPIDDVRRIGFLDEKCPSHQELETHIRLSKYCQYSVVPEILWNYYVGRDDMISSNIEKHLEGLIYIMRKHSYQYRLYAYQNFLVRARRLWDKLNDTPDIKIKYRRQLLFIAPELPLLLLKRKLLNQ